MLGRRSSPREPVREKTEKKSAHERSSMFCGLGNCNLLIRFSVEPVQLTVGFSEGRGPNLGC